MNDISKYREKIQMMKICKFKRETLDYKGLWTSIPANPLRTKVEMYKFLCSIKLKYFYKKNNVQVHTSSQEPKLKALFFLPRPTIVSILSVN